MPTNLYVPGAPSIGKGRRRLLLPTAAVAGPTFNKWNAAMSAKNAGSRNAVLAVVGDSTTAGWGGQGTSAHTNDASFSAPRALAGLLTSASGASLFCDQNCLSGAGGTTPIGTFDQRVVLGSWSQLVNATSCSAGGSMIRCTAGTTPLQFTPTGVVDKFDIYYCINTGFGTFTAGVAGDTATTINTASTTSVGKTTVTAAGGLGTHTLKLTRVSGSCFLIGVVGYNSASKETSVFNLGYSGSKVGTVVPGWNYSTPQPWDPLPMLKVLAPDLTFINLTVNDWVAATNQANYSTYLQNLITAGLASGDVVVMSGAASNPISASAAQQLIYRNIAANLAASNNLQYIDLTAEMGDYASNVAASRMFDSLHPNSTYYAAQAAMMKSKMQSWGASV